MFKGIKKFFGGNNTAVNQHAIEVPYPSLLGLHLGGLLTIDAMKLKLLEPHLIIEGANHEQVIEAIGVVELDPQRKIVRYYTDDDAFLQIQAYGEHLEEITLWYFFDTKAIPESNWNEVLKSKVVSEQYYLDEKEFIRFWEGNEVVLLREKTYHRDGTHSETDQFCMVYTRDIDSSHSNKELLLVSAEEKLNTVTKLYDHELVRSTGFALSTIDIRSA